MQGFVDPLTEYPSYQDDSQNKTFNIGINSIPAGLNNLNFLNNTHNFKFSDTGKSTTADDVNFLNSHFPKVGGRPSLRNTGAYTSKSNTDTTSNNFGPAFCGLGVTFPEWWKNSWQSRFSNGEEKNKGQNSDGEKKCDWRQLIGAQNRIYPPNVQEKVMNKLEMDKKIPTSSNHHDGDVSPSYSIDGESFGYNNNVSTGEGKFRTNEIGCKRSFYERRKASLKSTKEPQKSLKTILSNFAERASLPGVMFLYTSMTACAKAAWCALLLLMLGAMSLHLFYLVNVYTSWPKNTQVSLGFDSLQFPAVTFCNVNPVRFSKLKHASRELQDLATKTKPTALVSRMMESSPEHLARLVRSEVEKQAEGTVYEDVVSDGIDFFEELFDPNHHRPDGTEDINGVNEAGPNTETDPKKVSSVSKRSVDDAYATAESRLTNKETASTSSPSVNIFDLLFGGSRGGGGGKNNSQKKKRPLGIFKRSISIPKRPTIRGVDMPDVLQPRRVESTNPKATTESTKTSEVSVGELIWGSGIQSTQADQGFATAQDDSNQTTINSGIAMIRDFGNQQSNRSQSERTDATDGVNPLTSTLSTTFRNDTTGRVSTMEPVTGSTQTPENTSSSYNSSHNNDTSSTEEDAYRQPINFINNIDFDTNNTRSEVEAEFLENEQYDTFSEPSVSSKLFDQFVFLFTQESRKTRIRLGHQIDDMLVDCSFNGHRCFPSDFTLRTSPVLGNCFTMDYDKMVSKRSGPKYGLSLVIFLEHDEFLKGLSSSSGGHVVIHDKKTFPFPEEDGLAIASGMEVNIAIRMMRVSRLGKPYGTCNDGQAFFNTFGIVYNRKTCQSFCEQSLIIQHCNCFDISMEEVQRIYNDTMLDTGNPCKSKEEFRCMLGIQRQYIARQLDCQCDNPCRETVYTKSMSLRQWPSDEYADVLVETLCESRSDKECEKYRNIHKRQFVQNFIKLNVFYEDLNYENVTELASYEATQFFSDVGGALGLWMGLSMMAVMELWHLLSSLSRFFAVLLWKRATCTIAS